MPPLRSDTGDTTHVSLARMSHRGVEIQLFDEYYCLSTSFSRTLESSAVSFFLTLEKLLRYSFVQRLNVIWPSGVGLKAFSIWILWLVCLWLLIPPQSVPRGISQLLPHLPSPLSITNCIVISAFVHAFISYPMFVILLLCVFTWPYRDIEEQDTMLALKKPLL